MWIFLPGAMLSIVDKDCAPDELLVRARRQEDISRVFPEAQVQKGGGTDYLYRAHIAREKVALRLAEAVRSIDYGNFKSAVAEDSRHDAYLRVWSAMHGFQEGERFSRI